MLTTASDSTQVTTTYVNAVPPRSQSSKISVISTEASTAIHPTPTNKLAITSAAASTSRETVTPVKKSIASSSSSAIKDIPTTHSERGSTSTVQPTTGVPEKGTVGLLNRFILYINLHCFFLIILFSVYLFVIYPLVPLFLDNDFF